MKLEYSVLSERDRFFIECWHVERFAEWIVIGDKCGVDRRTVSSQVAEARTVVVQRFIGSTATD
jgi:hypothetical protein